MVDVADEYRKGIVYSAPPVVDPPPDQMQTESRADFSLSILWRELGFTHISFPIEPFHALLAESGAIEFDDCLIVSDCMPHCIHLDTLPGLRGRRQFLDGRLSIEADCIVLATPGSAMARPHNTSSYRIDFRYGEHLTFALENQWQITVEPHDSLAEPVCKRLTVLGLGCTVVTFLKLPDIRFSICIARTQT